MRVHGRGKAGGVQYRRAALGIAVLAGLVFLGTAEAETFYPDQTGAAPRTTGPSEPGPAPTSGATRLPPVQGRAVGPYAELIRAASERYRVDRRLIEAVVAVESAGNPRAVSRKGAQGLMQLMPGRAVELGVRDPFDPAQNLEGGVRHLRDLLRRFRGDVTLALAAYNSGEQAVRTHGDIPPYPETQEYVRRVRALYDIRKPPDPAPSLGQRADRRGEGPAEDVDAPHSRGSRIPACQRTRPGPPRAAQQAPQQVYRLESADGRVLYTNIPPHPGPLLRGGC